MSGSIRGVSTLEILVRQALPVQAVLEEEMEIPEHALKRAHRVSTDAAALGFDWPETLEALAKVHEEADELAEALRISDGIQDELGDLLFSVVNVARKCGLDPATALDKTTSKFERRFSFVVQQLKIQGIDQQDATLEIMDSLWNEAKRRERAGEAFS